MEDEGEPESVVVLIGQVVGAADVPSPFVVLVGVVVHVGAREGVDGRRGQGHVGPVGAVCLGGLGASLGFLLLASLTT